MTTEERESEYVWHGDLFSARHTVKIVLCHTDKAWYCVFKSISVIQFASATLVLVLSWLMRHYPVNMHSMTTHMLVSGMFFH